MTVRGILRSPMILLICTIGCAIAVLWPSPAPHLERIESAAPSYNAVSATVEQLNKVDGTMLTLHQEATLALAQLRTQADGER